MKEYGKTAGWHWDSFFECGNSNCSCVIVFLDSTECTWNDFLFEFFSGKGEMVQYTIEKRHKIYRVREMCCIRGLSKNSH